MGSRDRARKRKARAIENSNVHLNSLVSEIQQVLADAGLPHGQDEMISTVAALVQAVQEVSSSGSRTVDTGRSVRADRASRSTPSSIIDDLPFEFREADEFGSVELDDPELWELEEPGQDELTAPSTRAVQETSPTQPPTAQHPEAPGAPTGLPPLTADSAMAKLQSKLARAEKHGIKRGLPGAGGGSLGGRGPLVDGGSDKTPLDEQRQIMESLLGRPQQEPPPGRMKP